MRLEHSHAETVGLKWLIRTLDRPLDPSGTFTSLESCYLVNEHSLNRNFYEPDKKTLLSGSGSIEPRKIMVRGKGLEPSHLVSTTTSR